MEDPVGPALLGLLHAGERDLPVTAGLSPFPVVDDDCLIRQAREVPQPDEPFAILVFTLFGITANQPIDPTLAVCLVDRPGFWQAINSRMVLVSRIVWLE